MRKKLNWFSWWKDWSNFQPKQLEAEKALDTHDYVLYGGAAGGGKSYLLRKYPIKYLIEHCWHGKGLKGVRVGLFCEDYPALWERHLNRLKYEFPRMFLLNPLTPTALIRLRLSLCSLLLLFPSFQKSHLTARLVLVQGYHH